MKGWPQKASRGSLDYCGYRNHPMYRCRRDDWRGPAGFEIVRLLKGLFAPAFSHPHFRPYTTHALAHSLAKPIKTPPLHRLRSHAAQRTLVRARKSWRFRAAKKARQRPSDKALGTWRSNDTLRSGYHWDAFSSAQRRSLVYLQVTRGSSSLRRASRTKRHRTQEGSPAACHNNFFFCV